MYFRPALTPDHSDMFIEPTRENLYIRKPGKGLLIQERALKKEMMEIIATKPEIPKKNID
jgi:hypothetical protein